MTNETNVELVGMVRVSELFGPTIQGEGPLTGRRAVFARLGGCDLDCSWCDTPYTWDWDRFDPDVELTTIAVSDAVDRLHDLADNRQAALVISGGEPLIQRRAVAAIAAAWQWGPVQIETNGRHAPPSGMPDGVVYVVSPKLSNSGVDPDRAIRPGPLAALRAHGAHFKFVATTPADIDEIRGIVAATMTRIDRVWVMCEQGHRSTQPDPAIAEAAIAAGFNYTPRAHIALWGHARGK